MIPIKNTEARKRAQSKYKKKLREEGGEKRIEIAFSQADMDLYRFAKDREVPVAAYIKGLIREDRGRKPLEVKNVKF